MAEVTITISDLRTPTVDPMHTIGDCTRIGEKTYFYYYFASPALQGNAVYESSTEGQVTTTYKLRGMVGWAVVNTTSGYYGWVQTWGTLHDGVSAFKGLHDKSRAISINAPVRASDISAGKICGMSNGGLLAFSAGLACKYQIVGRTLEAIGSASAGASIYAMIRS